MKKADRFVIVMTILAFLATTFMIFHYNQERNHVVIRDVEGIATGDIQDAAYKVEKIEYNGAGNLLIKGWFVEKGVKYPFHNFGLDWHGESVYNNMNICLIKDSSVYVFPTRLEAREDVNESIEDDIDYAKCGFNAWISVKYSDLMNDSVMAVLVKDPYGGEKLYEIEK